MTKILFVCHGNICRSPMAEFVMKDLAAKGGFTWTDPDGGGTAAHGREADFLIASAATSTEELGNPVYPPARRKLLEEGIGTAANELGVRKHRAYRITRAEYDDYDLIVCMDENNLRNLKRWLRIADDEWNEARAGSVPKVSLLLEHAPEEYTSGRSRWDGLEVADPWYTGNFDATWEDVCAGCRGLLEELK